MKKINKEDYYFTEEDFNTFKEECVNSISDEIRQKRLDVQEKLLDLNKEVLKKIVLSKMDLHNHYNSKNITSLTFPCEWNKGRVSWIGIRYGRSKKDIDLLNYGNISKDDNLGFQKYACMQINVAYDGVDAGIFHAVPYQSVDRANMHYLIYEPEFQDKLIEEIKKIQGLGFKWHIGDGMYGDKEFNFDTEKPEDFIKFYKENDVDGTYSSMLYHFPRWDKRLKSECILDNTFEILETLYDFYETLIWKARED